MKQLFLRFQLLFVSLMLFTTFALTYAVLTRYNQRWDFTREKIYSLAEPTAKILDQMKKSPLEVKAFYPLQDPGRREFESFLKQVESRHPRLKAEFIDPDRAPRTAKDYGVNDLYTVVMKYEGRQEKVIRPTEESFSNALLRLLNPKTFQICFLTGHEESSILQQDRSGLSYLRESLVFNNYKVDEVTAQRGDIPSECLVTVVAGPRRDLDAQEYDALERFFQSGKGILFLIDPMDEGTGVSFRDFFLRFGIALGADVIVDKMSRMVGGDFLVPLVSQYVIQHPVTAQFKLPTFYPVTRTVQPSTETPKGIDVTPLAFTGSGSWAESDLKSLENGETDFDAGSDLTGPLAIAAAAEKKDVLGGASGRLIAVGDSDFAANAYLDLSGNRDFILAMIQWLTQDERAVTINPRLAEFKPLFLKDSGRAKLLVWVLGIIPLFFLCSGSAWLFYRHKTA